MARTANPQLARQWQERLDRFAESDLTIAEFCEAEGYSTASFYQWRRKLTGRQRSAAPTFVPINLRAGDPQQPCLGGIEVNLPGGARIKIPAGSTFADCRNLIQSIIDATATGSDANIDEALS